MPPLTLAAFDAGKHVVVEKPLAPSSADAARMIEAGAAAGLTLMVDHTYCYTPAVEYIHDIVAKGILGHVLYVDSTRINLGLVQPDVDVFWDLAPHDLAILDYALPGGLVPDHVSATGADPLGAGKACIGYATMPLANRGVAHVNVNWMSPTKIRRMVIGGSHRTLVWDDLNPQQRVAIHDRGIDLAASRDVGDVDKRRASAVSYRLGDITVPCPPGDRGTVLDGHRVRCRHSGATAAAHGRRRGAAGAFSAGSNLRESGRTWSTDASPTS